MSSKTKPVKINDNNDMNLKKIELLGFKSFPDKTEIVFDTNYTGIVGPNGCGKSNIVDAIRFVLGETRPTLLRCENMPKLIFEGSTSRKSFSYCEVSIYLNNNPRKYPIEYDEVVITRKLDRTGNSEYFINQKKHKQKDIIDLFRDSGIGRDGYSIVGQGQIVKIFESSPINRRAIFEEAVGISLQKSQKEDTERRLARARDNMQRLKDIILEVENQLTPLKKQAKNARDVKDLKKRLKILEIFNFLDKTIASTETKNKLNKELFKVEKDLKEIVVKLEKTSKALSDARMDRTNTDTYQNKQNEEKFRIVVEAGKADTEKKLLAQSIETHKGKIKELQSTIELHSSLFESKNIEIRESKEEIKQFLAKIERISSEIKLEEEKYFTQKSEIDSLEKAAEKATDMLVEGNQEKANIDKVVSALQLEQKILLDAMGEDQNLFKQKNGQIENYKNLIKNNEEELKSFNFEQTKTEEILKKENNHYELITKDLENIKEKIIKLEKDISNFEYEYNIVKSNIEKFDDYDNSIQTIMQNGEKDKDFAKLYHGTVGELIKVSKDLALAIEMALGNAIQNIIVEDEYCASKLIDFLKNERAGRATFLPLSAMKDVDNRFLDTGICDEDGVIGVASELITFSSKYSKAINYLLGRTIIVQDKSCGINISRKYSNLIKLVTLDGEIFNPGGAITGGSIGKSFRKILLNESRLKETESKIKTYKNELKRFEDLKKETEHKHSLLFSSIKVLEARIVKIKQDYTVKSSEKEKNTVFLNALEEEMKGITAGNEKSCIRLKELEKLIEDEKVKLKLIGDREVSPEDFVAEVKNNLFIAREKFNITQNHFHDLKVQEESLKNQKANLENQITALEGQINISQQIITSSSQKLNDTQVMLEEAKISLDSSTFSEEYQKKIDEIDANIKKAIDYKDTLENKISSLETLKSEYTNEQLSLEKKQYTISNELSNIDLSLSSLSERIMETYQYSYQEAQKFFANNVDKEVRESIEVLKVSEEIRSINNKIDRIGPTNELADEEYETTLGRYNEMQEQHQDLIDAEKDMVKMIKNLTEEMSEKFSKNFQKINEYFQEMFTGLFGGGKAYLELDQDVDVLEAGIEIKAQLPGSKLSSIISLSGGEKGLISIAILFAIIKLNPMPFCILDEIDSALDEANSNLLGQYLKKFSDDTQFVIVTHKKPTMEQCDVLYGITSQEKGVSQQVKVELEEAVKLSKQTVTFED